MSRPSRLGLLALALGAAALAAAYWSALDAPFYLDSRLHLVERQHLHLAKISIQGLWDAMHLDFGGRLYRPLSNLTLALTYWASGLSPRAFRLGNLAIHLAATAAAAFLFLAVLQSPRVRGTRPGLGRSAWCVALCAAALWAFHPVQTNVVTYVIQRMAGLAGLFTFLSVGCYLRARSTPETGWNWRWAAAAGAAAALALASKENAVVIPLLWAAGEWALLDPPGRRFPKRGVGFLAGTVAVGAAAAVVMLGPAFLETQRAVWATLPYSPLQRLLTEIRLQANYLVLLLVPDPRLLNLDAQVTPSSGLLSPPATLAMVLAVCLGLGWALARRRKTPLAAFCLLWFFGSQVVEGTFLSLELYFEHRLYIPSAALWLAVCAAGARLARGRPRVRVFAAVAVALFLAAELTGTYARNQVWAHPLTLLADTVVKAPQKPRPRVNFGHFLRLYGRLDLAQEELERALDLGPDPATAAAAHRNLAAVALARGDPDAARSHLSQALTLAPEKGGGIHREWAAVELGEGNLNAAYQHLEAAVARTPRDAQAWRLMGRVLLRQGKPARAEVAFRRSLRFDPDAPGGWYGLGEALTARGAFGEAARMYGEALRRAPENTAYQEAARRSPRKTAGTGNAR